MQKLNKLWCTFPWTANVCTALAAYVPKLPSLRRDTRIRTLSIATTNICNARCVFCAYPITKQKRGVMDGSIFANAITLAKSLEGITHVDLTPTVGDPLIDPHLETRIEVLRALDKRVSITTNCILMNYERAWSLLTAGVNEIYVSLPSFDKATYIRVYGVDCSAAVTEGVSVLLQLSNVFNFKLHLRFRNCEKPSKVMEHYAFQTLVVPSVRADKLTFNFTSTFDNWGGTITQLPAGMKLLTEGSTSRIPCKGLKHLSVTFDGKLRACGCRFQTGEDDSLVIGHINTTPTDVIIQRMNELVRRFKSGNRPVTCKQCSFYDPV